MRKREFNSTTFEIIFAASPANGATYREPGETFYFKFPERTWFQERLATIRRAERSNGLAVQRFNSHSDR